MATGYQDVLQDANRIQGFDFGDTSLDGLRGFTVSRSHETGYDVNSNAQIPTSLNGNELANFLASAADAEDSGVPADMQPVFDQEQLARCAKIPEARDDDTDAEGENEFLAAKQKIRHLRNKGIATDADEVEYTRQEMAHNARVKRLKHSRIPSHNVEQAPGDENMFVPESEEGPNAGENEMRPAKRQRKNLTTTARSKRGGKSAAEALTAETEPTSIFTARKQKPSKRKEREDKMRERQEHNLTNLDKPLYGGSIFTDLSNNTGRDDNPTFQSTRRKKALTELVSSIPEEDQAIARIDMKQMERHLKQFTPNGSCRSDGDGGWALTGLKSHLSHYQMLGVAWMRNREVQSSGSDSNSTPGGLIADAMGLGKTVMMIANIVNDIGYWRTRVKSNKLSATLIVLPSALISQWNSEIKTHAIRLETQRQHSGNFLICRDGHGLDTSDFDKYDIVLTTYSQVCRDYPKYNPPAEYMTAEQKKEWWEAHCEEHMGPLLKHKWRRIVLDEAQAIKNHKSQTSIAVRALQAKFYWAITGTPAQNSIQEFYPYFKFLKVPGTGSFRIFKQNMCTEDETGHDRLAQLLKTFMLRRTHADELLGAKLLVLPKTSSSTINLSFTNLERVIYSTVHKCFINRINGFAQKGTLQAHHNHVLCMLLRLRQLVGHPLLLVDALRDILDEKDYAEIQAVIDEPVRRNSSEQVIISHLRQMLAVSKEELPVLDPFGRQNQLGDRVSSQVQEEEGRTLPGSSAEHAITVEDNSNRDGAATDNDEYGAGAEFGIRNNYGDFFEHLRLTRAAPKLNEECAYCGHGPTNPIRATCGHILCVDCMDDLRTDTANAKLQGLGNGKISCPNPDCGKLWQQVKPHIPKQPPQNPYKPTPSTQQKQKKPSIPKVVDTWVDAEGKMLPSTKTNAVKAALLNFQKSEPGTKSIIYTSFLTMVFILEKLCKIEGFGYVLLHGSMDLSQRDAAIKAFEESPEKLVLIATLKCGGVGLNLTMASRVILIDLWWNNSVEEQAFCRTYRRGQSKPTIFYRLVVSGTVDDHLVAMQERKEDEILAVMQSRNKRFDANELMKLFGEVGMDSKNRPFILVDDVHKSRAKPHRTDEGEEDGAQHEDDD